MTTEESEVGEGLQVTQGTDPYQGNLIPGYAFLFRLLRFPSASAWQETPEQGSRASEDGTGENQPGVHWAEVRQTSGTGRLAWCPVSQLREILEMPMEQPRKWGSRDGDGHLPKILCLL